MRTSIIASTALAAVLFAGGALAAEHGTADKGAATRGAATQGAATQGAAKMDAARSDRAMTTAGSDQSAALQGEHFELIGRKVIGQNGDAVGEIDNVLVDAQGKPTHVVLGHGGWLGMGEKSIALGFDKLQVTRDDVRVTLSDDQLSALPGYEDTTERNAGMAAPDRNQDRNQDRDRQAAEGMRTTTTPPDQSAATPDAGAKVPPNGTVGGPSGASLDATPGVMKEPVKPKPAD